MRESVFERSVIRDLRRMFPGCEIMKNDASLVQGIPDRTILFNHHWAMLEVKASEYAPFRPNQEYYLTLFNSMAYAAVIYPSNKEQIYDELQQALAPSGCTCNPESQ